MSFFNAYAFKINYLRVLSPFLLHVCVEFSLRKYSGLHAISKKHLHTYLSKDKIYCKIGLLLWSDSMVF